MGAVKVVVRTSTEKGANRGDLLARVSLPPDGGHTNLGRLLHHVPIGDACGVEHGLGAGEVMAAGEVGGPAVEVAAGGDALELEVVLGGLGVEGRGGAFLRHAGRLLCLAGSSVGVSR